MASGVSTGSQGDFLANEYLLNFPDHVLLHTLSYLDLLSLHRCGRSNRTLYLFVDILQRRPTWTVFQSPPIVASPEDREPLKPHSWCQAAIQAMIQENEMSTPNVGFLTLDQSFPASLDIGGLFPPGMKMIGSLAKCMLGVDSRGVARETDAGPWDVSSLALAALPDVDTSIIEATSAELQDPRTVPAIMDRLAAEGKDWKVFVLQVSAECANVDTFTQALNERFPGSQLIGGLVEPQPNGLMTLQNGQTRVFGDGLVGMAMAGNLVFNSQVSNANEPLSDAFVVSRCEGNEIYDVQPLAKDPDPQPSAISILSPVLDVIQNTGGAVPFFIGLGDDDANGYELHQLVRITHNSSGEESGVELGYGLNIRAGQYIRIFGLNPTHAQMDIDARLKAAQECCASQSKVPLGALLYTCGGRATSFYERCGVETEIFKRRLPKTPLSGLFALGEIGPAAMAAQPPSSSLRAPPKLQAFTAVFGIWFVPQFALPSLDRLKRNPAAEFQRVQQERFERLNRGPPA